MANDEPTSFSCRVIVRPWLFIVHHSSFILFLVVVAVLAVNFRLCMREGWWGSGPKENGSDFTALYSAGELARHGEDIYDYERSSTPRRPFIYPPMFAVFPMAPLSLLQHNAALAVYWVLNILLLFASLWLLRAVLWPTTCRPPSEPRALASGPGAAIRHADPYGRGSEWKEARSQEPSSFWRRPETGLVLAVLVCGRFLNSNLRLGNANMYILFLLALALYLLVSNRGFWAGLSVALAMAFKVTPGLFGLYLLWSRRGRALAGGALGVALFFVLVPGAVLGFAENWEMLKAFAQHARGAVSAQKNTRDTGGGGSGTGLTQAPPASGGGIAVGWKNRPRDSQEAQAVGVSLRGAMQKLLSPSVALNRREQSEDRTVNVLNLTAQQAARVADVLSLALLAITIALTAPRWAREGRCPLVLSLGLVTSAMLLISPLTRKAHLVVLLIPVATLIALLQQNMLTGAARRWAWASVLVLGLHGLVFSADLVGQRVSEVVQAAGATTLSVLLLYVATGMALRAVKNSAKRC